MMGIAYKTLRHNTHKDESSKFEWSILDFCDGRWSSSALDIGEDPKK